jgi:radical SAM protein with 4Fe4S-binding SPASM domain
LAELEVAILSVVGGEPLLRNDLLDILRYAHKSGFVVALGTNGILIDSVIAEELSNVTDSVLVSLDSAIPEIHDRIRGLEGAFQKAVEGIKLLLAARCRVIVEATITKMNCERFPELLDLGAQLGVSEFFVHGCVAAGRAVQNYEEVILGGTALVQLLQEIKQREKANSLSRTKINIYMPAYETLTNDPLTRVCRAGELVCSIGARGDVFPCWAFNSYTQMSAGNIRKKDFTDIWLDSPLLSYFRNAKATMLGGKCAACLRKEVCLGGCKAAAYGVYGDIFSGDPGCSY